MSFFWSSMSLLMRIGLLLWGRHMVGIWFVVHGAMLMIDQLDSRTSTRKEVQGVSMVVLPLKSLIEVMMGYSQL